MAASGPSKEQVDLASSLGIDIASDTFDVAAARLLDAVASAIGQEPSEPSSQSQRDLAASLGQDVSADSKRVASAKIGEAFLARNQDAISSLDLKTGDRVVRVDRFEFDGKLRTIEREFVISSIQPNGRVFFKGGNGRGAWPTQLRRAAG